MCRTKTGPEVDSGSYDFSVSPSGKNQMLNQVQYDNFLLFKFQTILKTHVQEF